MAAAAWIDVAAVAAFPPGSHRTLDVDGTAVAVFNIDGAYYAIADTCSHEAETLSDGVVEGREIVCPRHGARFSLVTGAALGPPAYEAVASFPVRIADGMVQVAAIS
ncbi:MAG: non-heme iron oxygenase ferredoxin subunit [Rhodocyclaceae bacterium]|nr:non-heme iron oxygenase ferredoxin subunit [Rhodocyclaceae bacterium]